MDLGTIASQGGAPDGEADGMEGGQGGISDGGQGGGSDGGQGGGLARMKHQQGCVFHQGEHFYTSSNDHMKTKFKLYKSLLSQDSQSLETTTNKKRKQANSKSVESKRYFLYVLFTSFVFFLYCVALILLLLYFVDQKSAQVNFPLKRLLL
jgi:hypothetical protein